MTFFSDIFTKQTWGTIDRKLLLPHKPKRELLLHRLPFDMIGSGMCFDHHHDHC